MNPIALINKTSRQWRTLLAAIPLMASSTGMALTGDIPMLQTAAPTIDGVLDPAYTVNNPGHPIANTIGEGVVDNYQDFRAKWWSVWDETNLYVFIQVTDQFITDSHGTAVWQNDNVEIYLNMDNVRNPADNARTGDNYQYAFPWNAEDFGITTNASDVGVEWAQVTTDTGYTVEVLFPWTTLTTLDIEQGMNIGFDIAINDNDGLETYDAINYWYSDSSLWGNMDPAGTVELTAPAGSTTVPMVAEADVPTVDGAVDPIYMAGLGNDIDSVSAGVVNNATDFSAQWWGLWDDDKFYLVIEVTDQFLSSTAGAAVYQNDVVEVYFNMDNVRFPAGHARTGDNYQYSFKWNNPGQNAVSGSATMEGVEFAETTTEDGYIMEIAFPWSVLSSAITPADGLQIGFDIAVNDNDGKSANDSTVYWQSSRALWSNMDNAGTVELDALFDGNYPPVIAPVAAQKVNQGAELAFDVTATDADVDDTIAFTAEFLPDFIVLTDDGAGVATLTATVPAEAALGMYQFNLIASDGEKSDSEVITLFVTDPAVARQVPTFVDPYSVALSAGESVTFDVGVTDLDSVNVIVDDNPQGFARLAPLADDATAPAVDGTIEDTYSSAQAIGRLQGSGVVTDATDFSATWQGTWDEDNFYLVIDINDESLNDSAGAAVWQNDVVEVYFNMDNVRAPAGHARTGDNYQYAFHWNKPDEQNVSGDGSFEGVQWTQVNTDDGYTVEVLFPWATLTDLTVDEGFIFGFDIAINDNDGGTDYEAVNYWNSDHALWGNMDGSGTVMLGQGPSFASVTNNPLDSSGTVTITTTAETELGDYVVTILGKDEQSNIGILNLPLSVTPADWNGFPRTGNWVETGSFMGMIYVGDEPWIYSEGSAEWFFLASDSLSADGAWIYSYGLVAGDPNTTNNDFWAGHAIDTGWAVTPIGAIYVDGVAPWGYILGLGAWGYIPADAVTAEGTWIYAVDSNPEVQ